MAGTHPRAPQSFPTWDELETQNNASAAESTDAASGRRLLRFALVGLVLAAAVGVTIFRGRILSRFEVPLAERVRIVREAHAAIPASEMGVEEPVEITSAGSLCGSVPMVEFTDCKGQRLRVQFSEYRDERWGLPAPDDTAGWRLIVTRPSKKGQSAKRVGYDSQFAKAFHGLMVRWSQSRTIRRRAEQLFDAPHRTKAEIAEGAEYDRRLSTSADAGNPRLNSLRYSAVVNHRPQLSHADRSLLKACSFVWFLDRIYCHDRWKAVRGEDEFPRWSWP